MSSDHLLGQRAVQQHRVPVALVEVVAGRDRRVGRPQLLGELRLALEADSTADRPPRRDRANILPATLNTEVSKPNGNVSSEPRKVRHRSLSASPFTGES